MNSSRVGPGHVESATLWTHLVHLGLGIDLFFFFLRIGFTLLITSNMLRDTERGQNTPQAAFNAALNRPQDFMEEQLTGPNTTSS